MNTFTYRARPGRVIDGDTVELVVDLGFYIEHRIRVRVDGIDTPELRRGTPKHREHGRLAREFVILWMAEAVAGPPWPLTVATGKGKSFDRWVGTITRTDGNDLAADVIAWGDAHGIECRPRS